MRLIPVNTYVRKLLSIYIFAEDIINLLKTPKIKSILIQQKLSILDEVLKEYKIIPEKVPPALQKITEELRKGIETMIEEQKKRVEEIYPLTIINQSLSMMCSIFESFLIEFLDIIFDKDNRYLIRLSQEKEMKLHKIIQHKTFDEVISYFKEKTLTAFSRDSVKDKFKKYFKRIDLDISKFFDMSRYTEKVQIKFKNWDLRKLDSIFVERHGIVHEQQYPLSSLNELYDRKQFFENIILNMSLEITDRLDIPNELGIRIQK
jgi:hypothetical protein